LEQAGKRGVDVKILLDFNTSTETEWVRDKRIKAVKWGEVRFGNPSFFWTYHLKMAIVDDVVLFGSANWSYSGMVKNREGLLVLEEPNILSECEKVFKEDWDNGLTDVQKIKRAKKSISFFSLSMKMEKLIRLLKRKQK
jgi:phosphatidylserine/phosphatidylglycerophosphate/cardiolipin synthase-like enzyme